MLIFDMEANLSKTDYSTPSTHKIDPLSWCITITQHLLHKLLGRVGSGDLLMELLHHTKKENHHPPNIFKAHKIWNHWVDY